VFTTIAIESISVSQETKPPKSGRERAAILIAKKFGIALVLASTIAELAFDIVRRQS
jgi:hypothetical protein